MMLFSILLAVDRSRRFDDLDEAPPGAARERCDRGSGRKPLARRTQSR